MSDRQLKKNETDDTANEKELMDIFYGMDDDLINQQIDELLAEKGESIDMENLKEKAFKKLEKGKNKRILIKRAAAVCAVAALTVSTVYAKDIKTAFQSFFGKSTVYQTVVDGEAYYLPEELALGDKYVLKYANMSEGTLDISVTSTEKMTDDWYESLELSVAEYGGGESYSGGGYGYNDGTVEVYFYEIPTLKEFVLSLDGETYPVTLVKAESLKVDESLVMGVSEKANGAVNAQDGDEAVPMPFIANVAASRTDDSSGVGINIAVAFDDNNLKLNRIGADTTKTTFSRMFVNDENGILGSGGGPAAEPIKAYDTNNNEYELRVPSNAVGRPVTVFETNAAPGTPLTVKVPAIEAHYEKEVDKVTLNIPKDGETEINQEIDFVIQKAVLKTIKRISETTAEVTFDINTGSDENVKICDISAYSRDVIKGETTITGDTAVMTLTFDKDIDKAEVQFSWPYFLIEGNWSIELE